MFSRISGIPILLGAAIAVPYLTTNGPEGVKQWWGSHSAPEDGPAPKPVSPALVELDSTPRGPGHEIYPVTTPLEGVPSVALEDVFRFDITKDWVYQRWARKSTALAELGLFGIRVPLVTGTQVHDLAGSLTYFFNSHGAVERISFRGNTGDTTRIVAVAQQNGLVHQTTPIAGEQLLQVKRGSDVFSELRTKPSSVLWSSSPHESFSVELTMQRPDASIPLPSTLPPLPEVKIPASELAENSKSAKEDKKSFRESMKAFFPRSRVPADQVQSLEKRDRIW